MRMLKTQDGGELTANDVDDHARSKDTNEPGKEHRAAAVLCDRVPASQAEVEE